MPDHYIMFPAEHGQHNNTMGMGPISNSAACVLLHCMPNNVFYDVTNCTNAINNVSLQHHIQNSFARVVLQQTSFIPVGHSLTTSLISTSVTHKVKASIYYVQDFV